MRDIKEIEKRYKDPKRIPKKGSHLLKKRYLLILILLIAFFTNPSVEKHKEAVKQRVNKIVLPADPSGSGFVGNHPYVDQFVESYVSRTDYYLFSTTTVSRDYQVITIGLGIFGHVFISDMVDEKLKQIGSKP
ncbi:hypothetical protein D0T84_15415 [Dysgonomonas sp. 521]|uniref:DUF4359 domain-containing protein n=1 Tax=Dysgonomonas sp. 521 TaxID=2302932 RepID=UPI0013D18EA8|nr:DUF4359 domain-containing protein [Dysgonomonas sp. 521]NDV96290.1 hypothetical protein [Dysgonomonas sp. 521]